MVGLNLWMYLPLPLCQNLNEVAEVADEAANPSEFISSYNKLNDYMNTTPDVLGMTV